MRELDAIDCTYRTNIRTLPDREVADCGLLQLLTGEEGGSHCQVDRSICQSCLGSFPPAGLRLNPVTSSLLYSYCDRLPEPDRSTIEVGPAGGRNLRLQHLRSCAEQAVLQSEFGDARPVVACCDVVVCCDNASQHAEQAIRSILDQQDALVFVHLVDDGGDGSAVVERFADRSNVITHRNAARKGLFATLHELVPRLRTPYVAVQECCTVSRPFRIAYSVGLLEEFGAEFLVARLQTPAGVVEAERIGDAYARYVPPQTLVMRRASLVDMGGMAVRDGDEDAELIFRAHLEKRRMIRAERTTVDHLEDWDAGGVGPRPQYSERNGSFRHHARGYEMQPVACDAVLPFHGHLDYVEQALDSLLSQDESELVIHLVDDASPDDTHEFLDRWNTHPRVRAYRNLQNIGQFATFNNVVPFFETDLVVVQDADDISRPQRCYRGGNALRLAGADIFGSAVELFGEDQVVKPQFGASDDRHSVQRADRRWSMYPPSSVNRNFLENPSAMFRVDMFRCLGGFADFGDLHRNRASLDTEFYIRACYGGARFAISRDVLVGYRCHQESATQNQVTGWGSAARAESLTETERRRALMRSGQFDVRSLGALGCHAGLTQRLDN